ncbi:MAG: hypothetical protein AMJ78_04420 [Omnitrophica WOR_2 bacterium SM23_29]|nr:MAG: hypothetical protein AMJ78_04420 [Omnitrophica WOR_2 bacterium SM23_29]
MKKIKVILLFFFVVSLISLVIFMISISDKIPSNIFCFLDIGTYRIPPNAVEVNNSNVYGQSFVSNFSNLFMMSIFIPTQDLNSDKELSFHLKNNKDDVKDLVALKWKFNQIYFKENNFYLVPPDRELTEQGFHFHFQFPPIKDSKNKEFYFYFEASNAKVGEGIKLGVWDDIDYYEALAKGQMFINHKPVDGFLAFRTYNTWEGEAKDILNEMYSRFRKDTPFGIFYLGLLFINFVGLLLISKN